MRTHLLTLLACIALAIAGFGCDGDDDGGAGGERGAGGILGRGGTGGTGATGGTGGTGGNNIPGDGGSGGGPSADVCDFEDDGFAGIGDVVDILCDENLDQFCAQMPAACEEECDELKACSTCVRSNCCQHCPPGSDCRGFMACLGECEKEPEENQLFCLLACADEFDEDEGIENFHACITGECESVCDTEGFDDEFPL